MHIAPVLRVLNLAWLWLAMALVAPAAGHAATPRRPAASAPPTKMWRARPEPRPAGPIKVTPVHLYDQEYVRFSAWTEAHGFTLRRSGGDFLGSNSWARLAITHDSRRATLNGLTVWFSHSVVRRGDEAYLAQSDLNTVINPILWPPKNTAGAKVKTICLDPGHGGKDPGNQEGKYQEKQYTLLLAREVQRQLQAAGLKVVMTRKDDTFVELANRTDYARKQRADLFVSLHYNSAPDRTVRGIETFCLTPAYASSSNAGGEGAETGPRPGNRYDSKNMLLALQLHKSLIQSLEVEDRGLKRARFMVLKTATMPAVMVEGGFMSHAAEMRQVIDSGHRRDTARAITDGILAYKRLVER